MDPVLSARAGDGSDRGGKPRVGMLDTRVYQDLEPLRLPSKLRDRIARVQRRAAAEKDGVSIFTATTNVILSASEDTSLPHASDARRSTTTRRESTNMATPVAREKMHLPEVVLSHKMREFEAKMNVNAVFVDPLENNLHHLTIEDKERVMLKMQAKIQAITAEVDAHFVAIKSELDSHGIFDAAANYQRAQALCLVELQKRCKLEKIRDDAMREVLGEDGGGGPATISDMEGKLNELLARGGDGRAEDEEVASARRRQVAASQQLQRNTKSSMAKRRPTVVRRVLSPVKTRHAVSAISYAPPNQTETEGASLGGASSRVRSTEEASSSAGTGGGAPPAEDWTMRHPHIVQALQSLSALDGGAAPPTADSIESSSTSRRVGESGAAEDGTPRSVGRSLTLAEEWAERSTSYRTIACRVGEELRQRRARERWDSTHHFTSGGSQFATVLPAPLVQRVHHSQATPSARRSEEEERQRALQRELSNEERRKAADALYAQTRELIQSKRQRAAFKASRVASAAGTRVSRPPTRGAALGGSASAPTLPQPVGGGVSSTQSFTLADKREEERSRKLSVLIDRKRSSRIRGDSLIGAPVATDLSTLGHHSNARIEERRQSAQTWAWHQPEQRQPISPIHPVVEEGEEGEDEEEDEDERRDTIADGDGGAGNSMDEGGGGEDDDEGEDMTEDGSVDGDDARSVRSALSSRSARKPQRRRSVTRTRHSRRASPVRGPRGSRLMSRPSNSSTLSGSSGGMFAGVPFTANAQVLQQRLEELWRVLDFPFGSKLVMLEKYADSPGDGDALAKALGHWEAAAEMVVVREKLRHILDEYEELETVKASSLLSPADWSYLLMHGVEIPPNAIALSPASLVKWLQGHMDSVTHRCEKVAQQLKAATGDELVFQGQRYPPRV